MKTHCQLRPSLLVLLMLLLSTLVAACNLSSSPENVVDLTQEATPGAPPTRTPAGTLSVPTTLPLTRVGGPTPLPGGARPTSIAVFPTSIIPPPVNPPTQAPVPVSIVILSPIPGNVVAGNVQVLGSAIHPQFLQYQLEYGPDPNPGNLWFPATGAITSPVLNNLLGIWNTTAVQDGTYQLRLRVFLRDASSLMTVVNNIRIQNRVPTPPPSATPNVPRPIAAFTVDRWSGQAPLLVRFANQSTGSVSAVQWNFGDGSTSSEIHPQHTFNQPGLYMVSLTVSGPGGSSNVSGQINVQGPSAPSAGFSMDRDSGPSPLTVQFTDQSVGNITSYNWNFSDGTTSTERNPSHVFTIPGTYNVFLTVTGPGGSSSTRREVTVLGPTQTPPPTLTPQPTETATETAVATDTEQPTSTATAQAPTAQFAANPVEGVDRTVQFTDQSTSAAGSIVAWAWNFGDGSTSSDQNPQHTYATSGTFDVSLTVTDSNGLTSAPYTAQVSVAEPVPPPSANFSSAPVPGMDRTIQFTDASTTPAGSIVAWMWDFGDGATSNEQNPQHTYSSSGDFIVTLTVTDSSGRTSAPFSAQVNVAEPAIPPVANFSAAPAGDLAIQFTDTSSSSAPGGITSWLWEFGDGQSSSEQNPLHTYAASGSYTVNLTVSDANGSHMTSQQVEVAEPAGPPPEEESELVQNTPPLPSIGGNVQNNLSGIFSAGQGQGRRAGVFTVAGDESAATSDYLDPFAPGGNYSLDDGTAGLQSIIDWYNQVDLGGVTSFNRASLATGSGWTVEDLLDPDNRDTSRCDDGESPLACELRNSQAAVVIISVGYHDISNGTSVDDFRNRLQQVVQTATNMGVIPVLTTVQPRSESVGATAAINEAIIQVANDNNVPVYNLWSSLKALPGDGLSGSSPSVAPSGPGDLSGSATSNFGANARNRDVLAILDMIRNAIFPDAAP